MSYKFDSNCRYTTNDEWLRVEDDLVVIGISDFAQSQLSDIVFVELPETGTEVEAGEAIAVVESVKAAADVYSPISGEIVEINEALDDAPELVNDDPFGEAWFFKVAPSNLDEFEALMDKEAYMANVAERENE